MEHPFRSWCGALPFLMSVAILILMILDSVPVFDPLPIHDEGLLEHLAMLLLVGQMPFILTLLVIGHRQPRRLLPVLAAQFGLQALVFSAGKLLHHRAEARVAQRVEAHRPLVGSEDSLHGLLTGGESGALLSSALRRQLDHDLALALLEARALGTLQSLSFLGVDGIGWDRFAARYEKSVLEWRIFVTDAGKVVGLTMITANGACRSSEPYECRKIAAIGTNPPQTLPQ